MPGPKEDRKIIPSKCCFISACQIVVRCSFSSAFTICFHKFHLLIRKGILQGYKGFAPQFRLRKKRRGVLEGFGRVSSAAVKRWLLTLYRFSKDAELNFFTSKIGLNMKLWSWVAVQGLYGLENLWLAGSTGGCPSDSFWLPRRMAEGTSQSRVMWRSVK